MKKDLESVVKLEQVVRHWGSDQFAAQLKAELEQLDPNLLPLQQGLSQSSYVGSAPLRVVFLNSSEIGDSIQVKVGVFYSGVIAGSCCSDDPTPVNEITEYCELELTIEKHSAETEVSLIATDN